MLVNYRTHPDEAEEVVAAITALGRRGLAWQADVGDRAQVERMVQAAVEHFGRSGYRCRQCRFQRAPPVLEADWEGVKRTTDVTLFGVFHTTQLAARQMVAQGQGGKIVIISSIVSEFCFGAPAYSMSNRPSTTWARCWHSEMAPHHINVNVISPGWIDTPGERVFFSEDDLREGAKISLGGAWVPGAISAGSRVSLVRRC